MNTKQIIVIRTKYPHPKKPDEFFKPRTGKLMAQAAHASLAFLTRQIQLPEESVIKEDSENDPQLNALGYQVKIQISIPEAIWIKSSYAKICVYVESEEELLEIKDRAEKAGLKAHLVVDSGRTEFNGIPTPTCVAIGPDYSDKIDEITGHLKPY